MESTDIQQQDYIVNVEIINEEPSVKLKKGRKPKDKPENIEPQIQRKVGRPKKEQTEPVERKKIGRPPLGENRKIFDKEYYKTYYYEKLQRESQCPFCKKTFSSPNGLRSHQSRDKSCMIIRLMIMNKNLQENFNSTKSNNDLSSKDESSMIIRVMDLNF